MFFYVSREYSRFSWRTSDKLFRQHFSWALPRGWRGSRVLRIRYYHRICHNQGIKVCLPLTLKVQRRSHINKCILCLTEDGSADAEAAITSTTRCRSTLISYTSWVIWQRDMLFCLRWSHSDQSKSKVQVVVRSYLADRKHDWDFG